MIRSTLKYTGYNWLYTRTEIVGTGKDQIVFKESFELYPEDLEFLATVFLQGKQENYFYAGMQTGDVYRGEEGEATWFERGNLQAPLEQHPRTLAAVFGNRHKN